LGAEDDLSLLEGGKWYASDLSGRDESGKKDSGKGQDRTGRRGAGVGQSGSFWEEEMVRRKNRKGEPTTKLRSLKRNWDFGRSKRGGLHA